MNAQPQMTPISLADAAELTGLSIGYLRQKRSAGVLGINPPQINGRAYIEVRHLIAWLRERAARTQSPARRVPARKPYLRLVVSNN